MLGLWALGRVWILGPSGFLFVLVPAAPLLVLARLKGGPAAAA
ncbi:hypothetical protein [Brachybacterium sp. GPGPB12]